MMSFLARLIEFWVVLSVASLHMPGAADVRHARDVWLWLRVGGDPP